jgi:hypothetical protein
MVALRERHSTIRNSYWRIHENMATNSRKNYSSAELSVPILEIIPSEWPIVKKGGDAHTGCPLIPRQGGPGVVHFAEN